jgi:hypothetical protein
MAKLYLEELYGAIARNCLEVDTWVRRECGSTDLRASIDKCHANLDGSEPGRSYLVNPFPTTSIWDIYFHDILRRWDYDTLSAQQYNYIIQRLSQNATQLNKLIPLLEDELDRPKKLAESEDGATASVIITNATNSQSCLTSFLDSAQQGLDYWRREEGSQFLHQTREILTKSLRLTHKEQCTPTTRYFQLSCRQKPRKSHPWADQPRYQHHRPVLQVLCTDL